MRQEAYTLATLGNPLPAYLVTEVMWWGEWSAVGFATRRALAQIGKPAATTALLGMLRDQSVSRRDASHRNSAPPDVSKRDAEGEDEDPS